MNKSEKKQKEEPLLNEKKESKNDDSLDKKYRVIKVTMTKLVSTALEELDLKPYHIDNGYHLNDKGVDIQAELLFKKMVLKNDFR